MGNIFSESNQNRKSIGLLILILFGFELAAVFAFNFIGLLFILPYFDFDIHTVQMILSNPTAYENAKIPLLLVLTTTSIGTFMLVPAWVISKYGGVPLTYFLKLKPPLLATTGLTLGITLSFAVVNSVIIERNESIVFPEFLSAFEAYLQAQEAQLAVLTRFITEFDGLGHFFLGLIAIAIIPAIGEEFLFRGLFQNIFHTALRNPHIAIWVSAFLFSAFHNQFYGLVPRMLLGAIFGYLYYWSGSLAWSVFAHFINNGFSLLMIYLFQIGLIKIDILGSQTIFDTVLIMFFFIFTLLLLYSFRNLFIKQNDSLAKSI